MEYTYEELERAREIIEAEEERQVKELQKAAKNCGYKVELRIKT